ncbi:MAG: YesL family protein [Dorea sp.]
MNFLFNEDNFLTAALLRLWDLVLANLLFILCSIPLVTIGPALTALYHCTLRIVKGNHSGTLKTFFRAFKQNFKQSIIVWLVTVLMAMIIYSNFSFLKQIDSTFAEILTYSTFGITVILAIFNIYIYPVIAAFEGSLKALIKNAFIFASVNFIKTILMLLIWGFPLLMTYMDVQLQPLYVFCWFFFLFATLAYICSFMLYKMFKPYLPKDETTEEDTELKFLGKHSS